MVALEQFVHSSILCAQHVPLWPEHMLVLLEVVRHSSVAPSLALFSDMPNV